MFFNKKKKKKSNFIVDDKNDRFLIETISPSLIVNNWDHMIVNNDYVRMLNITKWPNKLPLDWASMFEGAGGCNYPVTLILKLRDSATVNKMINLSANEAERWDVSKASETKVDRQNREFQASQATSAANMIVQANSKLFEMYVYIKVNAKNDEELEDLTSSVTEDIESHHLIAEPQFANQLEMFWGASPCMCDDSYTEARYNFSAPSAQIARAIWNKSSGICDATGISLGTDEMGGLVRIDPTVTSFTRMNGNMLMIGQSGSGKSSLLKKTVLNLTCFFGAKVFIHDFDKEFIKLAKETGGSVVCLNSSSPMIVSPFEPRNLSSNYDFSDSSTLDKELEDEEISRARKEALNAFVLASHLPFITEFLLMSFGLKRDLKDIVYRACNIAYNKYGIYDDMRFFEYYQSEQKFPCLKDIYDALDQVIDEQPHQKQAILDLKFALNRAVSGPEKRLWQTSNQKIGDSPLVVFDMQSLMQDPDMLAAQYYNILTWEWTQICSQRYSGQKTVIVSDEIQRAFNASNIDFCKRYADMVSRARKYGGLMITCTQLVSNFYDVGCQREAEQVVSNSAFNFVGTTTGDINKEGTNARAVKSILGATDDVMQKLANVKRGKFILRAGSEEECWVDIKLKPWELELFGKGGGK